MSSEKSNLASGLAWGVLFILVVPAAAHFLFSWIGFNSTDDGVVLAYSRRLLDGQVPPLLGSVEKVGFITLRGI